MSRVISTHYQYGLRHANGYIREFDSLKDAQDRKSGRVIDGRIGDWANHTIVGRVVETIATEWEEVAE